MTAADDPVLDTLTRANPYPRDSIAEAGEDPHAHAMLTEILARPAASRPVAHRRDGRQSGWRVLAPVLSLVVVAAVVAVALHVGMSGHRPAAVINGARTKEFVLRLHPTAEVPRITAAAVAQEIQILRARLRYAGTAGARFTRHGDELAVHLRELAIPRRVRALLAADPRLAFTDWEQNVIAPDGRTVASLLPGGNRQAELLSQGHGGLAGGPDAGALTLYAAARLASRQPARPAAETQTRLGAESFAFAPAGSGACRASRVPCWAGGPSATPTAAARAARGTGVTRPVVLTVPQGTIIVRASEPGAALAPDYRSGGARYFVLRDDAALTGLDLRRSAAATDAAGQPDVDLTVTPAGARAFHALTAAVARRGRRLQIGATPSYQHIAVIVDGALASVPLIDYHAYPDGISGSSSLQIDGLSRGQATALAATLRLRTLPLRASIAVPGR